MTAKPSILPPKAPGPEAEPAAAQAPDPAPETQYIMEEITDDQPPPPASRGTWWLAGGLAVVAAVGPYLWLSLRRPVANSTPPAAEVGPNTVASSLGFRATRENGDWKLAWDRQSVAKLDPVGAMLTINDGGAQRVQFLAPVDLASGFILYVSHGSDLLFNLKVTGVSGDVEERIRVLGAQ